MGLHRDLGPVAGLAGDATDLDEAVCDLGHLELEQRPDELRIPPGQDDLGALRARADLRDDRLDAAPLLVAFAVDLLGARQQGLHLAEVDENVVAITSLLDDAGHDLANPIDVLLVHHRPLGLTDPLEDHLLGGLRGDATEVLGRHVLPRHVLRWNLGPVEVEVVVRDECVRLLSGLDLGGLELVELPLARLLEQPRLEVVGNLDRVDAEVPLVVERHLRVPGCTGCLLVGGEERVLEGVDEGHRLDALLLLDLPDGLDDLPSHGSRSR